MIAPNPVAPQESAPATLICLHSSASSGRQWQALLPWLDRRLRVQAPDLLGYAPGEAWPTGWPVSLAGEAARFEALLAASVGGVHLLGHSYGGAVALEVARRWPAQVRSLTLYEPVRFGLLLSDPAEPAGAEQIVSVARRIQMLVLSGCRHEAASCFVDYWTGEGTWEALSRSQQDGIARRMTKVQAEFEALFADRVPAQDFAALRMPVRLIGGRRSPLAARQVLDRLATLLPQSTCSWIEGAGHMAPITEPGLVAMHLPDWLSAPEERLAA